MNSEFGGPVYTPRGLKIRFPASYVFGLLTRLWPSRRPTQVMDTVEGIEMIPAALSHIAGIVVLWSGISLLPGAVLVIVAAMLGKLVIWFGFPFMLPVSCLGLMLSDIPWLLRIVGMLGISYFLRGWSGVWLWVGASIGSSIIGQAVEFFLARRMFRKVNVPLTQSEVCFYHAYLAHASAVRASTDLELSPHEEEEETWRPTFLAYTYERAIPVTFTGLQVTYMVAFWVYVLCYGLLMYCGNVPSASNFIWVPYGVIRWLVLPFSFLTACMFRDTGSSWGDSFLHFLLCFIPPVAVCQYWSLGKRLRYQRMWKAEEELGRKLGS